MGRDPARAGPPVRASALCPGPVGPSDSASEAAWRRDHGYAPWGRGLDACFGVLESPVWIVRVAGVDYPSRRGGVSESSCISSDFGAAARVLHDEGKGGGGGCGTPDVPWKAVERRGRAI